MLPPRLTYQSARAGVVRGETLHGFLIRKGDGWRRWRHRCPDLRRGAGGALPRERVRPARPPVPDRRGAPDPVAALQSARHLSADARDLRHGRRRRSVPRNGEPRDAGRHRGAPTRPGAHPVRAGGESLPLHRHGSPGRHRKTPRGGARPQGRRRRVRDRVRVGGRARRPRDRNARPQRGSGGAHRRVRGRLRRRAQRRSAPAEPAVRGRCVRGAVHAGRHPDERRPSRRRAPAVPERIRSRRHLSHERDAAAHRRDGRQRGRRRALARPRAEDPGRARARGNRGAGASLEQLLPHPSPSRGEAAGRADVHRRRRRAHPQPVRRPGDEHGTARRLEPRLEARPRACAAGATRRCSAATKPNACP